MKNSGKIHDPSISRDTQRHQRHRLAHFEASFSGSSCQGKLWKISANIEVIWCFRKFKCTINIFPILSIDIIELSFFWGGPWQTFQVGAVFSRTKFPTKLLAMLSQAKELWADCAAKVFQIFTISSWAVKTHVILPLISKHPRWWEDGNVETHHENWCFLSSKKVVFLGHSKKQHFQDTVRNVKNDTWGNTCWRLAAQVYMQMNSCKEKESCVVDFRRVV